MATFDDVIGYDMEKETIFRICDILTDTERYAALGAKPPRGLVLYGPPGVGKTLMASAMTDRIGRPSVVLRRCAAEGNFISRIGEAFDEAERLSPSVLVLDDLDKFSEGGSHRFDEPEFTEVQSRVDSLGDKVFVIATVNDMARIPHSLFRPGRIEEHVEMKCPAYAEAVKIVAHYLEGEKVSPDVDAAEVAAILSGSSCAELEAALNDAAISSAFAGREKISREDLMKTLLYRCYDIDADAKDLTEKELEQNSYCVAGEAVVNFKNFDEAPVISAVCCASGADSRGLTLLGEKVRRRSGWEDVLKLCEGSLAGNAAYRLKYGRANERVGRSVRQAAGNIKYGVDTLGAFGFRYLCFSTDSEYKLKSQTMNVRRTEKITSELQRAYDEAEKILRENWDKVEAAARALRENIVLTSSEMTDILKG